MKFLSSLLRKSYHLGVVHPYAAVRACWPVWYHITNAQAKKYFQKSPPVLSIVQQRIVNDLYQNGIAVVHIDELFPNSLIMNDLKTYTYARLDSAEIKSGKTFLQFLWDLKPELDLENPFIKMVIDKNIIDVVNSYLCVWAKFYYFTLNKTIPVTTGVKPMQSQRWHRDPEDKRLCKVFLYLNDVDEEAGPFVYVKGSHYGGMWRSLFPQRPPHGVRAPYGEVEHRVPKKDIYSCTGRAGTIIFCDTSGLHKGGYATSKDRIMFTGVFATLASYKYTANPAMRYSNNFANTLRHANISKEAMFALECPQKTWVQRMEEKIKAVRKAADYEM